MIDEYSSPCFFWFARHLVGKLVIPKAHVLITKHSPVLKKQSHWKLVGGWTTPLKNRIFPNFRGENWKYLSCHNLGKYCLTSLKCSWNLITWRPAIHWSFIWMSWTQIFLLGNMIRLNIRQSVKTAWRPAKNTCFFMDVWCDLPHPFNFQPWQPMIWSLATEKNNSFNSWMFRVPGGWL